MNYSIQFELINNPFMSISARKKTLKHQLFYLSSGILLVKIGKHEYAVESGQYFWIPANCLVSITAFPLSKYSKVEISQRLNEPFATQAGYVSVHSIVTNAFELLAKTNLAADYKKVLLQVIKHEATNIKPKLTITDLSQSIAQCRSQISKENSMALKLREARKSILSGQNKSSIAQQAFNMDIDEFDVLCQAILGERL